MTRMPLVSVGLPTYNRAETLERAATSVLAQDWPEVELVISDNGSTDGTRAACEALRDLDSRVVYVRQETNLGPLRNFAEVLDRARGELFLWLGDDDWIDPTYVSACARELVDNPDHTIVCGRARYYRDGIFAFAEPELDVQSESAARRLIGYYRAVTLNGAYYGVMRRDDLLRQTLPDGMGGDWLFVARLAYLGKIRTLRTTAIHRSLGGSSRDASALAELHGAPRPKGGNWQLAVARNAFHDVRGAATYVEVSSRRRLLLALEIWVLIVSRFTLKTWVGGALGRLGLFDRARHLLEWRRRRAERS